MLERRRERRLTVHLPMKVRWTNSDGADLEEATRTENVCRGGVAFATKSVVAMGTDIEISIPVPPRGNQSDGDFTTRGRVVHLAQGTGQRQLLVGVEFTGPRFNRVFSSETSQ